MEEDELFTRLGKGKEELQKCVLIANAVYLERIFTSTEILSRCMRAETYLRKTEAELTVAAPDWDDLRGKSVKERAEGLGLAVVAQVLAGTRLSDLLLEMLGVLKELQEAHKAQLKQDAQGVDGKDYSKGRFHRKGKLPSANERYLAVLFVHELVKCAQLGHIGYYGALVMYYSGYDQLAPADKSNDDPAIRRFWTHFNRARHKVPDWMNAEFSALLIESSE